MFYLNGDIVRQLTNIYEFKFYKKFQKDIKERLDLFLKNTYENKSLLELQELQSEIEFKNLKIIKLNNTFFTKYKNDLLSFFNPDWYSTNVIKIKQTKREEENSKAILLNHLLTLLETSEVKEKYNQILKSRIPVNQRNETYSDLLRRRIIDGIFYDSDFIDVKSMYNSFIEEQLFLEKESILTKNYKSFIKCNKKDNCFYNYSLPIINYLNKLFQANKNFINNEFHPFTVDSLLQKEDFSIKDLPISMIKYFKDYEEISFMQTELNKIKEAL